MIDQVFKKTFINEWWIKLGLNCESFENRVWPCQLSLEEIIRVCEWSRIYPSCFQRNGYLGKGAIPMAKQHNDSG